MGFLILGLILSYWLSLPQWVFHTIGFVFGASLLLLIADSVFGTALSHFALLRRVHFEDQRIQGLVPWRIRWLGRGSMTAVRRYKSRYRRKGAWKALFLQRGCEVLAVLIFPAALSLAISGLYVENKWLSMGLVIGAPAVGISAIIKLVKTSRMLERKHLQYIAPQVQEVMDQETRAPIVLIRSFDSDGREAEFIVEQQVPMTFEEVVSKGLFKYGPVIAIGKPDEPLPPLGAIREYVGPDWQSRVREMLLSAKIILAVVDDTPGLLWEIAQIVELGLLERMILVVPQGDSAELAQKWRVLWGVMAAGRSELDEVGDPVGIGQALTLVFTRDLQARAIVGSHRLAEYYRDAVELGVWFINGGKG